MDQRTRKLMTRYCIPEMTLTDYMCQEKKVIGTVTKGLVQGLDDLQELKTVLMHRYNDSTTTKKNAEED